MSTVIQVRGCVNQGESVVSLAPDSEAQFYAVYVGECDGCDWVADFANKSDALLYAHAKSKAHGYPVDDQTYPS